MALVDAGLRDRSDGGQPDAIVDAERHVGIGDLEGIDRASESAEDREHVGEVELALGVVVAHLRQRLEQEAAVEGEDPRVDLADMELSLGGVARRLRLDDPLDRAVGGADDAPVPTRVLEHRGRDRPRR